jgi:integrase
LILACIVYWQARETLRLAAVPDFPFDPRPVAATPVLTLEETRSLLDRIDAGSLVGLRDRSLLSVLVYSFAGVSAVVGMRRQDYFL